MIELTAEYQFEAFVRLLYALAIGAVVGLEREFRGHEAGIRTTSLVCVGAAAFGETSNLYADSRIASNVVQGVGFLGAGLIFQRQDQVRGVTTAATLWVIAGLGLMVSSELWLTAGLLAITMVVLLELHPLSDWVYRNGRASGGQKPAAKDQDKGGMTGNDSPTGGSDEVGDKSADT